MWGGAAVEGTGRSAKERSPRKARSPQKSWGMHANPEHLGEVSPHLGSL